VNRKLLASTLACAAALWAPAALACGAPFGLGATVDPHQDILLSFRSGTEIYDFQPTFCGGSTAGFGLILPVPSTLSSPPAVGDAGAFAAAQTMTQPVVIHTTQCFPNGGLDAGSGGGLGGGGPAVIASGRVGFLDWTQLKADSTTSFTSWLDANGYPHDASANDAFSYYVNKGWYFIAFKITPGAPVDGGNGCVALGPVKLAFPTTTPVVPSRMATAGATAAGAGSSFIWSLYGITPGSAQLDFTAGYDPEEQRDFSGPIAAADVAKLDGLALAGDRITKLSLVFDATSTGDVSLTTSAASDYGQTVTDVTWVTCDDGGAPVDEGGLPIDDGGQPGDKTEVGPKGGGGCSLAGDAQGSLAAVALALLGLSALRRRRA
jgi:hypothetical protein